METETLTPPAEAAVFSPARNILRRGRTHWGEDPVEAAGLLADGRDYFRAFHEAASGAQNYILISGWQFDKDTALLRGADAADAQGEVRFLPFLDGLCRKNPRLRVYILAWNFNPILTLHREWMQEFVYNRVTCGQVKFRFDGGHALWASQHQKFAVIDGRLAFLGGMDLCARRWDDRGHAADNPLRAENGVPYEPGHDVQAWAAGPAALRLSLFFRRRWRVSGGGRLELPPPSPRGALPSGGLPLAARAAALSRTRARTLNPRTGILPAREIKRLYTAAVDAAERLIYIENQYFASEILFDALRRRLRDRSRPSLQIVLIYPLKMRTPYEALCLGLAQARMFRDLRQEADARGHNLGLYYTVTPGPGGTETPVYIHSKVMAVDDRFLTVGSANTTDRSLRLDTELNWAWEAPSSETELGRSIRAARVNLLAEHCGIGEEETEERKALAEPEGLVARLDALAADKNRRLRKRETDPYTRARGLLTSLKPRDLLLDPGKAVIEEALAGRGFTSWKEIF